MSFHVRAINPQLSASVDRLINGILTEGILTPADSFIVREQAAPDMSVRVGSGVAGDRIVIDAVNTFEGPYIGRLPDATQTVAIAAGDPSNDRIDLVVARVYDDEVDSSGTTDGILEVVEGTPASTPEAPAVPDGAIALAEVRVTVGESTSIVSGDITDRRVECQVRGSGADAVADADLVPFAHMRDYVEAQRGELVNSRGVAQSIPNSADTTIVFDQVDLGALGDHWSRTSGVFTAAVGADGRWRVNAQAAFASNTTGRRILVVRRNAASLATNRENANVGGDHYIQVVSQVLDIGVGDEIDIRVFQNSGGALNLLGGSALTWVSFERVSS